MSTFMSFKYMESKIAAEREREREREGRSKWEQHYRSPTILCRSDETFLKNHATILRCVGLFVRM
jgi:hypothetical protein